MVQVSLTACLTGIALADKLDDIKARGKLLVGTSDTSPPFTSRENGKVVGYDVDLAARVAQRLGVPMETSRSSTRTASPRCSRTASTWPPPASRAPTTAEAKWASASPISSRRTP